MIPNGNRLEPIITLSFLLLRLASKKVRFGTFGTLSAVSRSRGEYFGCTAARGWMPYWFFQERLGALT